MAGEQYYESNPEQLICIREHLLRWYDTNGRQFPWREKTSTNYQKIIAEVLLQRTRAETVATFFPYFFQEFPSWISLSSASLEKLQTFLQPIGLWRRRASSIQALAQEMVRRRGHFPSRRDEIEALPGVGQYIANAIFIFVHGEPKPLLDINMARVLERVFGPRKMTDIRYDPYLQELATSVVNCETPEKINWAILDLAAMICIRKKPHCELCPIERMCKWAMDDDR